MRTTTIPNAVLLAAAIVVGGAGSVFAQTKGADPHHPANASQQVLPSAAEDKTGQDEKAAPGSDMMPGGMMQPGMMGAMSPMGMRGQMMKIMFVITDTDEDGALSFEEVTSIHKRIFDSVDANKDGKVTPEEMRAFWGQ